MRSICSSRVGIPISVVFVALLCSACSSSSAPTPTPVPVAPPTPTPPPATGTIVSGRVTAVNGGQGLAGVAVGLADLTVTTDGAGAYVFPVLPPGSGSLRMTVTAASVVPRSLIAAFNGSRTLALDAIALGGGFDQTFYRQLVRDMQDRPAGSEALRRWTINPSFYMKVTDEAGVTMDAKTLDNTEQIIRAYVPQWTGGKFAVAAFERGTVARPLASGWININWSNQTRVVGLDSFACGDADVGRNPATINLYYKVGQNNSAGGCRCAGQSEMGSRVVSHELGHAMGFWHAGGVGDVMFPGTGDYCDANLTARERYHAAIAYARPVGNLDPDTDPTSAVLSLPRVTVH